MLNTGELKAPVLFYGGKVFPTEVVSSPGEPHYFGGELDLLIEGEMEIPLPFQRLVTLDVLDPQLDLPDLGLRMLPLVYGFRYDGGNLKYRVVDEYRILVDESSSLWPVEGWPYDGFPDVLPRKSLRLSPPIAASFEEFANIAWQPLASASADNLMVIVPPSEDYGVSLWGEMGDGEMVQVILEVSLEDRSVRGYNMCT